jgi:hypothetical protein
MRLTYLASSEQRDGQQDRHHVLQEFYQAAIPIVDVRVLGLRGTRSPGVVGLLS